MTGARKIRTDQRGAPNHIRLLLAIRKKRGWTQQQLACELFVHKSTIANWERGITDPHPSWVQRLEVLLNADPANPL